MFDKILIEKKISLIVGYLQEMDPLVSGFSVEELLKDNLKFHTLERLFQLIVDTITDINIHLIREKHQAIPDDLESTFVALAKLGTFPADFAEHIAPIVGLRNRVVHRYEKLDQKLFLETLVKNFPDFKQYLIFVQTINNE